MAMIGIYNGLVRLNVQANNAWADIDVQQKRRYDLIPNVIETVKGYASHERQTLEAVINARNRAVSAQGAGPASVVRRKARSYLRGHSGISRASSRQSVGKGRGRLRAALISDTVLAVVRQNGVVFTGDKPQVVRRLGASGKSRPIRDHYRPSTR
jgi:LemA family